MKINPKTEGMVAAPFTPMHDDKTLNLDMIEAYARHLHRRGVVGAFICGTTGEGVSLTVKERMQLAERWVEVAPGELRVMVHVGHVSLSESLELARHAQSVGADSVASMAPYFFTPAGVEDMVEWCEEIAAAAPVLPFYYYHMPSMTGFHMKVSDFLAEAAGRIPNLAGIKYTFEDLEDYKECLSFDDGRFDVLFGRDELLASSLRLGARGAVGSTYNFAAPLYADIIDAHDRGDTETADMLQEKAVKMIDAFIHCGAHPVAAFKWFMSRVGVDCGPSRLPLHLPSAEHIAALDAALAGAGVSKWVVQSVGRDDLLSGMDASELAVRV